MKPNIEELMVKLYPAAYGVERQPIKTYKEGEVEIKVYAKIEKIQGKYSTKKLPIHLRDDEDRNVNNFLTKKEH